MLLGLISCSTAAEREEGACGQIDWYQRGRTDGALGLGLETVNQYRKTCPDDFSSDDEVVYGNGRNAGLVEYCSSESGFEMGRMGVSYNHVCPSTTEPSFLAQFEKGQRARKLEMENDNFDSRMDLITQRLALNLSDDEKSSLRMELSTLKRLRAKNEKQLSRISK